jgi:hypothetical protein
MDKMVYVVYKKSDRLSGLKVLFMVWTFLYVFMEKRERHGQNGLCCLQKV